MTFQEQCMTVVFPRFIEGINAANRKAETLSSEVKHVFPRFSEGIDAVNGKVDALASEAAQLQAKVQELEIQLADAIDRVNALEAKAAEKKTRRPRAKKQADPVQSVEEAAKRAAVDKAMDAVLDAAKQRQEDAKLPEPGTYQTAGTAGTAGETKTVGVSGTAELPPDMQGIF